MPQAPTNDRKTKTDASAKTAEQLSEQEQSSQLMSGMGRSRSQQRGNLAALQKTYGNQAMLRMKGRSPAQTPVTASPLSRGGILQRKCACGNTAGSSETCAECQEKSGMALSGTIQTKLTINQPGDRYEQEADRVADQVMRMPEPSFQHQMEPEAKDEAGMVQRKAITNSITPLQSSSTDHNQSVEVPPIVDEVLRSPGQSLDLATRALMEPHFGYDFSQVRIHTGRVAEQSACEVNAHAYTVGRNIVFGSGQYALGMYKGQRLLAHELAHTIQQKGDNTIIQRMLACPSRLADTDPTPSGWKSYFGDPSVFHCGFRTILEDRIPAPIDPQNECVYDHSGVLVDENHPFAGCRGTPDQYDSASSPVSHIFRDSGGIWNAGGPAFLTSRIYQLSRPIAAAIEVATTATNIISSVVEGFESSIALGVLTAQASVDPGNWQFQGLPSRTRRHLNVMGNIIGSAALSQNVETLLSNLTRRLDSFPINGLIYEIAEDVNQTPRPSGLATQQVTSSDLGALSLIQLVEWLCVQGIMQYLRPPEAIAREQLAVQQRAIR